MALSARLREIDWEPVLSRLDSHGVARCDGLLNRAQCRSLIALYDRSQRFRSRVVMARHGFGAGEYQYFAYPLPRPVSTLRRSVYPLLAPIANDWAARLGRDLRYPATLEEMLERCHAAGQQRPTPLLLRYRVGDYNCLHQDLYGPHVFPIQLAIVLSDAGRDFAGGEFVITEQRPRMQSRVEVITPAQGDGIVFAVNERPRRGSRGEHVVRMRHGVSELRRGERYTLGVIFHDAA